jgi:hypothetical protein
VVAGKFSPKSLKDFLAYLLAIIGWYGSQASVPITRFTDFSTNNVDKIVEKISENQKKLLTIP